MLGIRQPRQCDQFMTSDTSSQSTDELILEALPRLTYLEKVVILDLCRLMTPADKLQELVSNSVAK